MGHDIMVLTDRHKIDAFFNRVRKIIGVQNENIQAGLDFEFDYNFKTKTHDMALGQIALASTSDTMHTNTQTVIALFDFRLFNPSQKKTFITDILINPTVLKILHGSESLDLPALRLFIKNDKLFKIFLSQMTDTRFLCEAYNVLRLKYPDNWAGSQYVYDKKCGIYNALYSTRTITKQEFDKLNSIQVDYRVRWSISKLSNTQITYAAADVMFLRNLLKSYTVLLGCNMIKKVNIAYGLSMLHRMGITQDASTGTSTASIVTQNTIVKSNTAVLEFTFKDLLQIDYLRKPLTMLYPL